MKSLSIVFPGQGSQSSGMLSDIAKEFPEILQTFAESSSVLGFDLWKLIQDGPTDELNKTINTQPALLTASYAIWKILAKHNNIKPRFLAGHSLGEYTALVCSGAINFTDAIELVASRGKYMQDAVPEGLGALAAIVGLENDRVQSICKEAAFDEVLSPANFNSLGQVVIAGQKSAVLRAIELSKKAGAKLAKLLPVSVPSHCILMKSASEKLAKKLATIIIHKPNLPVVNNVDVQIYDNANDIREGLTHQLFQPVRWVETIQYFKSNEIDHIIECGPGKVLSGLNKRIEPDIKLSNTADLTSLKDVLKHDIQ